MNTRLKIGSKLSFALSFGLVLSACGGSGSSDESTSSYGTFDEIDADATMAIGAYLDGSVDLQSGVSVTDAGNLPSGSVAYTGFVTGTVDDAALIGTVALTANFATNAVAGSATDFFHETDGAYTGTLSGNGLVNTAATGSTPQVTATLDGNLSNGGNTYATTLAFDGDFLTLGGIEATAIAGLVEGDVGGMTYDDGLFAAEN